MGKIVVSENLTLDGVLQDPTGDEGFSAGGWFGRLNDSDREEWAKVQRDEALGAQALLLGRRTYEFFCARWPLRRGTWADRLNSMPKFVVSTTLQDPAWNNSTVLAGDTVRRVAALRRKINGDIVVYASFQLIPTLLQHGLVDELRLKVYPVAVGLGERLFGDTGCSNQLRLIEARAVRDGLAFLTYQPVRDA